jgi:mono/diheme cytochrome c family protein
MSPRCFSIGALLVSFSAVATPAAEVTYTRDVAPIFYQHCTACHHPNDIAPMSLMAYQSTRPWAQAIREAVLLKKMPPWFADRSVGHFANDPSLTDAERQTIVAWVDNGSKEGDPKDLPPAPVYADGWRIGKPDAIFDIGEDHVIKATAVDEYVYFTVPTHFTEGHWVQAVELRPGNRKVVHHAHVSVVQPDAPKAGSPTTATNNKHFADYLLRTSDGLRHMLPESPVVNDACAYSGPAIDRLHIAGEGALSSYLPGMPPDIYRGDTAKWIPAGAQLRFQIHYHSEASGSARESVTDRTSVGLIFASAPPRYPLRRMDVDNDFFSIAAGASDQTVTQCATFKSDSLLLSVMPHMHYRGKDARFEIQRPGETSTETLLLVPQYDFNWQLKYVLQTPVVIPKGTRLIMTFHYDNSINNKFNPDPLRTIRWGEPSQEEMMSGWIDYIEAPATTALSSLTH